MHHSTAQHRTGQHTTAQHNTAQHRTTQHNAAQHNTAYSKQHLGMHSNTRPHSTIYTTRVNTAQDSVCKILKIIKAQWLFKNPMLAAWLLPFLILKRQVHPARRPQNQSFGSLDALSDDLDALEALGNRILMPLDAL